jgi:branched-chain amino acid aminotransferase
MLDNVGSFILLNDKLLPSSEASAFFKDTGLTSVYEVIRIIDSKPLFIEDHYQRLTKSLELTGIKIQYTLDKMRSQISSLLESTASNVCNIRIVVSKDLSESIIILLYIAKSSYPSPDIFKSGVSVSLFNIERKNPNVKIINTDYKTAVTEKINLTGVFEVLLVNSKDFVTEGSRSNVFFIKDNNVFTAPGQYVLEGITRKYVISACNNAGLNVVEKLVSISDLQEMDAAFLSGTSIKALPISKVDNILLSSQTSKSMTKIMQQYDIILDNYIQNYKY